MPTPQRTEPRCLVTADEIAQAILWRVKGLDREKKADLLGRVKDLPKYIHTDHPAVANFLREIEQAFPKDRRSSWTLLCSLVALNDKTARGYAFWTAGMVVLGAHRKARQQPEKRACDELSLLIAAFLGNHPEAKPREIWTHFTDVTLLCSDVLADYNPSTDMLSYYPDDTDPDHWEPISYETFARRVRRVRETIIDHSNPDTGYSCPG